MATLTLLVVGCQIWLGLLVAIGNAKVTTKAPPRPKLCHDQGKLDSIFTRTFSVLSMQRYCEMLDSSSVTLGRANKIWPSISDRSGACYDRSNWRFDPADFRYILKSVFRYHLDVDKDGAMSPMERARFLEPALRYHLLPGMRAGEYKHVVQNYFGHRLDEGAFVDAALRMMRTEWRTLVQRLVPDLDDDACVTKIEYARAVCRKEINDVDLFFRTADLDGNRAVTRPEFEEFKALTPVEPGEKKGADKFMNMFARLFKITETYTEDYYQQTSFAHDDMLTFNEVNLYVCLNVI